MHNHPRSFWLAQSLTNAGLDRDNDPGRFLAAPRYIASTALHASGRAALAVQMNRWLAAHGFDGPTHRAAVIAAARKAEPDAFAWKLAEAYDRFEAGRAFALPALGAESPAMEVQAVLRLAAWHGAASAAGLLARAEALAAGSKSPDDRLLVGLLQLRAGRLDDARRTLEEVLRSRGRVWPECEYGLALLALRRGDRAAARDWLAKGDTFCRKYATEARLCALAGVVGQTLTAMGVLALPEQILPCRVNGDWRDEIRLQAWRREILAGLR